MALKNLEKTLFLNIADEPYLSADWASREKVIEILRETSKQIKRLIEYSDLVFQIGIEKVEALQGANAAIEFGCEALSNLEKPIEKIKLILQDKCDEIEFMSLDDNESFKQSSLHIPYHNTFSRVLKRIIMMTDELGE